MPHFLNWLRSSGCSLFLERVRSSVSEARDVALQQREDAVSDQEGEQPQEQEYDDRQARGGKKPQLADVADSAAVDGRKGAPTTLRFASGGESHQTATTGGEEEANTEATGKRRRKKKEASDTE